MSPRRSFTRVASSVVLAASLQLAPSVVRAEPAPELEGSGHLLVSDLLGMRTGGMGYLSMLTPGFFSPAMSGLLGYTHQEVSSLQGPFAWRQRRDTFSVNPSLDALVSRRWTLGVSLGYARHEQEDVVTGMGGDSLPPTRQHGELLAVAPRVGYLSPVGRGLTLWTRLGVAYSRSKNVHETLGAEVSEDGHFLGERWGVGVDVGLVYRPLESLYFSGGPELSVALDRFEREYGGAYDGVGTLDVHLAGTLSMGLVLGP